MGMGYGLASSGIFRAPYPLQRTLYGGGSGMGGSSPLGALIGGALQAYRGERQQQFEDQLQTEQEQDRKAREDADEKNRAIGQMLQLRGAGLSETPAYQPGWEKQPPVGTQAPAATDSQGTRFYPTTPTKAVVGKAMLDLPAPAPGGTTATGGVAPEPKSPTAEPVVPVMRGGKRIYVPRSQAAGQEAPTPGGRGGTAASGNFTPAQVAQAQRAFATQRETELNAHHLPEGAPPEAVQAALRGAEMRAQAAVEQSMGAAPGSLAWLRSGIAPAGAAAPAPAADGGNPYR